MTDEKRIEEIRGRLAALPSGFVLGVEGSYYDDRHLVANMWGEAEEGGDAGPLDPNEPALLDFRDHAMSDFAFLLAALDAERARADRAEAERDARPAITAEDAALFVEAYDETDCPSVITDNTGAHYIVSVVVTMGALRAHAAKAGGGT